MEKFVTDRGFGIIRFKDSNGKKSSLQESSSASEPKIWLGIDDPDLIVSEGGKCIEVKMPTGNFSTHGRMHLTQSQVKELLPSLIKFAETGNL